jgi:hypothetical protein
VARIGLAAVALGTAVVLGACGGGGGGGDDDAGDGGDSGGVGAGTGGASVSGGDFAEQSADDIVASAKADMGELEAVRVSGSLTSDDQQIEVDIQVGSDGDCTGSIGVGDGTAELLGVDGTTWMRPDKAFWQNAAGGQAAAIINLVGDKWVVIPTQDESLNQFCDVDGLLEQLLENDDDSSTYSNAGTDEVDGEEVVKIDNEDEEEGTSTGYVLVGEPHYLVKIEKTEGEETGSVAFSDFDVTFEVEAPADEDVIDLNSAGS